MPPRWYRQFQKPTPMPSSMAKYRGPKPAPASVPTPPSFSYMDVINMGLPPGLPGRVSQMVLAEMAFRNGGYLPSQMQSAQPVPVPPQPTPPPQTTPAAPPRIMLGPPAPWAPNMPYQPPDEWEYKPRSRRSRVIPIPSSLGAQKEPLPNYNPPWYAPEYYGRYTYVNPPESSDFFSFGPWWLRALVDWGLQNWYRKARTQQT